MIGAGQPIEKRFALDETDLCYFEWGNPSDQTILMLHATGFHARCWDKTIAALPGDYHVIAVDHRGHGRSGKPDSLSNWRLNARDVSRLVDGLALQNVVGVGHSMGGHVLVQVVATHQDLFDRLVLVDPTIVEREVYADAPDLAEIDPSAHPVARRRNVWDSSAQMFDHFKDRHPYSLWQPNVLMDYCEHGLLASSKGDHLELACPPHLESSIYQGFRNTDPYPSLEQISCPVLILRAQQGEREGAMDFANSPTWPGLATAFQSAREIHIPELSHFMPMQDPKQIAHLIVGG